MVSICALLDAMSSDSSPTRTKILAAARQLLEGGGQVRMSDIARAAGISRQAVYLHFSTRADLLVALTRWMDEVNEIDRLLAPSRTAPDGPARLDAWVAAWGSYIPKVHAVARALMAMYETDAEARAAWDDRMAAMRDGCAAAVRALSADGCLRDDLSEQQAIDLLWTLLSVRNWDHLCRDCGWSEEVYVVRMQDLARRALCD